MQLVRWVAEELSEKLRLGSHREDALPGLIMQRRTKHYNSVCPQQLYDRHNKAFTFVACGAVQDIALDSTT